jgi:hypothetical protein
MNRTKAIQILTRFAAEAVDSLPRSRQIEIYKALSTVLPDENQRQSAGSIAFTLGEAEKLQLEFAKSLFATKTDGGNGQGDGRNS